jgi:hypothetical protein
MYIAIITIAVLGYFSVLALRGIGHLLMPWRKK